MLQNVMPSIGLFCVVVVIDTRTVAMVLRQGRYKDLTNIQIWHQSYGWPETGWVDFKEYFTA